MYDNNDQAPGNLVGRTHGTIGPSVGCGSEGLQ